MPRARNEDLGVRIALPGIMVVALFTLGVAGCGGSSGPSQEENLAKVAQSHLRSMQNYNASGACGRMSRNAAAESEENADSAIDSDGGTFESDIPSGATEFCEYRVYENRDNSLDAIEEEPGAGDFQATTVAFLSNLEFPSVQVNQTGVTATLTSNPYSYEDLGAIRFLRKTQPEEVEAIREAAKLRFRTKYFLVKEDGKWLIDRVDQMATSPDGESEEETVFPFD